MYKFNEKVLPLIPANGEVKVDKVVNNSVHLVLDGSVIIAEDLKTLLQGSDVKKLRGGDIFVVDETGQTTEIKPFSPKVDTSNATGATPLAGGKDRHL